MTLKENERVIKTLQNERRLSDIKPYFQILNYSSESLILQDNVALILKTAKAIRKTEAVPSYDRRPSEASIIPMNTFRSSRISIDGEREPSQDSPHVYSASLPNHTIASSHTHVRESSEADIRMPPPSGPPITGQRRPQRRPQRESTRLRGGSLVSQKKGLERHPSTVSNAADSRESGAIGLHKPKFGIVASSVSTRSNTHSQSNTIESEYLNVRPLDNVLKMAKSLKSERISGYLELSNKSWLPVSGILEPEQEFSFISVTLASEMNLLYQVEQYTGEDGEIWIQSFGGRKIKPIGRICIRWRTSRIHLRPVSVLFWVFNYHQERNLVLGKEFLSRIRPDESKAGETQD